LEGVCGKTPLLTWRVGTSNRTLLFLNTLRDDIIQARWLPRRPVILRAV